MTTDSIDGAAEPASVRDWAAIYVERERWRIVPVPLGEKNPIDPGWPDKIYTPAQITGNVGVILGPVSRGLVDVDHDSYWSLRLASYFLPPTVTFGRASKRASHWLYYCDGLRSQNFIFARGGKLERVELRAQNAASDRCGHQTVFPGSIHESGESIEWDENSADEIATIEAGDLKWRTTRLATASVIAEEMREGNQRNNQARAWSGGLLQAHWTAEEVRELFVAVYDVTGADDAQTARDLDAIERTIVAFENGAQITSFGSLVSDSLIDPAVVRRVEMLCRTPDTLARELKMAGTVAGKATAERLIREAQDTDKLTAVADEIAERIMPREAAEVESALPRVTLLDRLRARRAEDANALATGIKSLDARLTFGGVLTTKRVVIGGAPDAGKTALALQIAEHMSEHGAAVAWIAVDEDAADIDTRRVQALGCARTAAQGVLTDDWLSRVETALGGRTFDVFEDEPADAVIAEMAVRYPDRNRVVVVDSLQTARSTNSMTADGRRAQVDAVIADIKAAQLEHPTMVIATSELNRSAYRNKDQAANVEPMAAAKESGAIEYAATLLLMLTSEADGSVAVDVPKNKMGSKSAFRLRLDPQTLRFAETSDPGTEQGIALAVEGFVAVLAAAVKSNEGALTQTEIRSRARAAKVAFTNGKEGEIIGAGVQAGKIRPVRGNPKKYTVPDTHIYERGLTEPQSANDGTRAPTPGAFAKRYNAVRHGRA